MSTLDNRTPGRTVEGVIATGGPVPFGEGSPRVPSNTPEPPRFNWQVVRSVRMHPALAAGVGGAVCFLLILLALAQSPVYKAESRVFVDPLVPGGISPTNGQPGYDQYRYGSYLDQQIQTVTRPDILTAALKSLPAGTWRKPGESEQSAVARLQKALLVERLTDGYEFSVKLSTPNAESSAALVNAVTNAYLSGGRKDELTQADGREQILSEERQRIKDALAADQKEQAALGTNLGVANPATESGNPFDLQLSNLRAQLEIAREAHDVAAAQLSSISGADESHKSGLTAVADESINTDLGLSSMKQSINQRRAVLQSQMAGLTPSNPQYKQDQDELADLDRMLDSETVKMRSAAERRIQDKLRADLQRTASVEAELNAQLARETAKATGAGPKLLRANELATDIRRLNERYTDVDTTLRALELQTNGPGVAHITLEAAVPSSPEGNRRALFLLAALPLGVFFGVGAAVLARLRDQRVYLASDLEEALGFPPLAVLPASSDVPPRVVHEYLLRFAAGVEGAYRSAGARTFLVTGVRAKSQTHALVNSLASKLDDLRIHVVVVSTSELLTTSRESGQHLAATGTEVSDRPANASEGIATSKLERLKAAYDLILVDAAPLLHAAETEYVARCVDATILVVESGEIRSPEVVRAAALLSRLHMNGVAVVLDGLRMRDADEQFREAVSAVEHRTIDAVARQRVETPKVPLRAVEPIGRTHEPVVLPDPIVSSEAILPAIPTVPSEPVIESVLSVASLVHTEAEAFQPQRLVQQQVEVEPEVVDPVSSSATRFAMPTEKPYVPDLFKNPSIRPVDPDKKITPKFRRRASDWTESGMGEPDPNLVRPFVPGAKRADGTPIPSAFASHPSNVAAVGSSLEPECTRTFAEAEPVPAVATFSSPVFEPEPVLAEAVASVQIPEHHEVPPPVIAASIAPKADPEERAFTLNQSKIRFAFKEERVNSKTTWFSKLFRGDPPSSFKIIPDEDEDEVTDGEWKPIEKQQLAVPEPEVRHPHPSASRFEASFLSPAAAHQPREVKTVDADPGFAARQQFPVLAPASPVTALSMEAPPQPVAPRFASLAPIPAPASIISAPPVVAPAAQVSEVTSERPLRPITFQQLSGEQSLEASHEINALEIEPTVTTTVPVAADLLPRVSTRAVDPWPEKSVVRSEPLPTQPVAANPDPAIAEPVLKSALQVVQPTPLRQGLGRLVSKLEATRFEATENTSVGDVPVAAPALAAGRSVRQFGDAAEFSEQEALPIQMPHEFRRQREIAGAGNGSDGIAGLSRRWALLSKYDPTETDPYPASRRVPEPEFSGSDPRVTEER